MVEFIQFNPTEPELDVLNSKPKNLESTKIIFSREGMNKARRELCGGNAVYNQPKQDV